MFSELCRLQYGIVTLKQVQEGGLSRAFVRARLKSGSWQDLGRGAYATFSGPLPRASTLWAAVLRCGEGATLSHHTAAETHHLVDEVGARVDVTIPVGRRIAPIPGIVIHHSRRLATARHPTRLPPQTRLEETVVDLVEAASSIDRAIALMSAAIGRRLTTAFKLQEAVNARSRLRWRREILIALADVDAGCHSLLELRYLRDVERAHCLPTGRRQARTTSSGHSIYRDVRYSDFSIVVELDGRLAHPVERRAHDLRRDNVEGLVGGTVLHFGWTAVTETPCVVAQEVGIALRARGWTGTVARCRACRVAA